VLTRSLGCVLIRLVNNMTKLELLIEHKLIRAQWLKDDIKSLSWYQVNEPHSPYGVKVRNEMIEWVAELTSDCERLECEIKDEIEKITGRKYE